jgi:hypothetical protein
MIMLVSDLNSKFRVLLSDEKNKGVLTGVQPLE